MRGNQQRLALTDQSLEVWQIKKAGGNEPPPGGAGKHLRDTSCCHGGAACGKLDVDNSDDWFRMVLSSTGCKLKAGTVVNCYPVSQMGQMFEASFGFSVLSPCSSLTLPELSYHCKQWVCPGLAAADIPRSVLYKCPGHCLFFILFLTCKDQRPIPSKPKFLTPT